MIHLAQSTAHLLLYPGLMLSIDFFRPTRVALPPATAEPWDELPGEECRNLRSVEAAPPIFDNELVLPASVAAGLTELSAVSAAGGFVLDSTAIYCSR